MRNVLLVCVVVAAAIAGCTSTSPPAPPPSSSPTALNTAPATYGEFVGQLLEKAGYSSATTNIWERGDILVTVKPEGEHKVSVEAMFTRLDGRIRCEVQAIKDAYVGAIDSLNELSTPQLALHPHCSLR